MLSNDGTSNNVVQTYLQTLTKKELAGLVMRYAPQHYFLEIQNKFAGREEAVTAFMKAKRALQKIFKGPEILYEPYEFEEAFTAEIEKISGLEVHLKEELEELIFYIFQEVENAFDEGYLYDNYSDDFFESPEVFDKFVLNYALTLSYEEKTGFLGRLDSLLREAGYSTFDSLRSIGEQAFDKEDLPYLKQLLLDNVAILSPHLVENYYRATRSLLSDKEKEKVLSRLKDSSSDWLIELVELFRVNNRIRESIDILNRWLDKNLHTYPSEVYFLYLDLLKDEKEQLAVAAKKAISHCTTLGMLQKIVSLLPAGADSEACEQILRKKSPEQMLNYLEACNRPDEGLALIRQSKGIWESRVDSFFKKHKNKFPKEAEEHFCKTIEKNLEHAGDHYYRAIADALEQLQTINVEMAETLLNEIRMNYRRRRNLMSLLAGRQS